MDAPLVWIAIQPPDALIPPRVRTPSGEEVRNTIQIDGEIVAVHGSGPGLILTRRVCSATEDE